MENSRFVRGQNEKIEWGRCLAHYQQANRGSSSVCDRDIGSLTRRRLGICLVMQNTLRHITRIFLVTPAHRFSSNVSSSPIILLLFHRVHWLLFVGRVWSNVRKTFGEIEVQRNVRELNEFNLLLEDLTKPFSCAEINRRTRIFMWWWAKSSNFVTVDFIRRKWKLAGEFYFSF